jgi:hypothetical protein
MGEIQPFHHSPAVMLSAVVCYSEMKCNWVAGKRMADPAGFPDSAIDGPDLSDPNLNPISFIRNRVPLGKLACVRHLKASERRNL